LSTFVSFFTILRCRRAQSQQETAASLNGEETENEL